MAFAPSVLSVNRVNHIAKPRWMKAALIAALLAGLIGVRPAHAQAALVSAQPAPGQRLQQAPAEIRLSFNRPLLAEGFSLMALNEAGERVDFGDSRIDPQHPTDLIVTLPLLFEGKFTVSYIASLLGSSVTLAGSYEFVLDLPEPVVGLLSPQNGQAFPTGSIPIRLQTRYVDFSAYNRRIRVTVDGQLHAELRGLRTSVEGLRPGVHQIRSVLVQFDDEEVPETATTVYIAVMTPGAQAAPATETAPPLSVPRPLSLTATVGLLMACALMLAGGVWLGRSGEP